MGKCKYCDMKGFLSFIILWILSKHKMTGSEIAMELKKRRGVKPSPGTIYPALKELKENGLIKSDNKKIYSLTNEGKKELKSATEYFCCFFYDIKEIQKSR